MTIEYMQLIAAIVAVISLVVSLIAHASDRHKLKGGLKNSNTFYTM